MKKIKFDRNKLQRIINREITQEEETRISQWEKGRALSQLSVLYGFDVILEMLESYVMDSINKLLKTDPKEEDEVKAEHAIAFASNRIYINFQEDVRQAIEDSKQPPEVITEQLKHATGAPPEGI